MKKLRYSLEACLLSLLLIIFKIMGLDTASAAGGWLGRTIGPRLGASKKALNNLRQAFPDKTNDDLNLILTDMWDNLGRTMAEYPHLKKIQQERLEWHGQLPEDTTPPYIFISAHMANWEILAASMNRFLPFPVHSLYRAPNNPYVAALLEKQRLSGGHADLIPKSKRGARDMVKAMKEGDSLGILIDQKYKEGLAIDFFGRPAMTSSAFADLALKYNAPIIPLHPVRTKGAYFTLTLCPPIETQGKAVEDIMREAHIILEQWISERPGQWLWLHRRWAKRKEQS